MAGWSITPLGANDIDEFVKCQFLSFVGNTMHDVVYPTESDAIVATEKAFGEIPKLQQGDEIVFLKAVDDETGAIVGGIKSCFYNSNDARATSPYISALPEGEPHGTDDEKYRHYLMTEFLQRRIAEIKGQHALLDLLFVHPNAFRRGIGKALVSRTCATADERGLMTIVEASPAGKRTYESCGFESKAPVITFRKHYEDRPDAQYYWMERQPLPKTKA